MKCYKKKVWEAQKIDIKLFFSVSYHFLLGLSHTKLLPDENGFRLVINLLLLHNLK